MKTPSFWQQKNIISTLLSPLGYVYGWATQFRIKHGHSGHISRPVICIGNITAGGTGKTPVAISIAKLLQQQGKHPYFVSRGYGGRLKGVIVDKQKHSAAEVGDEPLLLSRQAPVVVNPDRFKAALTAVKNGAELILMDDGFQNPGLHKDISFLVFDGGFGIGNGRIIPSGPLRETLENGLKRADAVIIIGKDKYNLSEKVNKLPVFKGKVVPVPPQTASKKAIAFAGIGRPEKFYTSLQECGFELVKTINFPDHHQYTENELKKLINQAQKENAELFTTSKDFVKIPVALQSNFQVLEIAVEWERPEFLSKFILDKIRL